MKHLKLKGRAISLFSNEKGFLLLEALAGMFILLLSMGLLAMSFKNVSTVEYTLESSQNLQIKEYVKLYKQVAPSVAQTLPIGGSVQFSIDSPNYLPTNGVKYLNLFQDYTITPEESLREGLTEPLKLYNNLFNTAVISIVRTEINGYSCSVTTRYHNFSTLRQIPTTVDTTRIETPSGTDVAKKTVGREMEYQLSFSGEIIPSEIKP